MGLDLAGIRGLAVCEKEFIVEYKGKQLGKHRIDLIVEDKSSSQSKNPLIP
jgi:hypothetical protein